MPWTDAARRHYARPAERYATDLTDAEWALLAPHLPAPNRLGRPREVDLREVLNAILYLLFGDRAREGSASMEVKGGEDRRSGDARP